MLTEKSYLELEVKRLTKELRILSNQHFQLYMSYSFSPETSSRIARINEDANSLQKQLDFAKQQLAKL